ncbi:protein of unknown function (plasmid) [Cupriavidus neocaledonicus]|uniref:Uncharacterized protein n=1 Tax=Cupriavidus neocaledonicus TaxID=1040979 RepID=A0A375HMB2_9BURK|nr:hypothetical protein CBM2605_B130274 [Cupriavidus neocaledonicus]SPD59379.1 protein of unknown function [Cupriavidus neocaledonicus]
MRRAMITPLMSSWQAKVTTKPLLRDRASVRDRRNGLRAAGHSVIDDRLFSAREQVSRLLSSEE